MNLIDLLPKIFVIGVIGIISGHIILQIISNNSNKKM